MAKAQTQVGRRALRALFTDASRDIEERREAAGWIDPNLPRDGVKPGEWEGFPSARMPPGCPVQIVGRDPNSGTVYVITATGNFRAVERWDMPTLLDIFTPQVHDLKYYFPAYKKKKIIDPETEEQREIAVVDRVERDKAIECLIQEAGRRGDFDPATQHRGRGGWRDGQDGFVWHSGEWLWTVENKRLTRSRPVMHDGFLYTRQAATIVPWSEPVDHEESPAVRILKELRDWNWQRPFLDPILVLGWIVTALMGGALKARPILFTTGGAGVGKSTLLDFIRQVLAGVAVATVNTTAAGIYQRAKHDALPFLIDELENKAGSTRAEAVIELMRVAYTGGDISRGGQDHEATTFTARNSFAAFAINAPPLGAQDKSRMALLNLSRLDFLNGIKRSIDVRPETDGRMLLRQVMDGWADFNGRLMQNYYAALRPHGLDSRAIDTFGTLLAAAELVVGPQVLEEVGLPVTDERALGETVAAATRVERSEMLDNWHECLDHLLQSTIDSWREGVKPTVGSVCEKLRLGSVDGGLSIDEARARLQLVNLGAVERGKVRGRPELGPVLAVPADGPALKRIYAETNFRLGGWYAALKGAPANVVIRGLRDGQKVKINGSTKTCLLVDIEAFERFAEAVE